MAFSVDLMAAMAMFVSLCFWLAGVHFSTKRNEKDIDRLWKEHKGLGDEIRDDLKELQAALHKINGSLFRLEGRQMMREEREDGDR